MKTFTLGVLLILAVLGQATDPAVAQTRTWTGGIGSGWELPTNWSPYGVPLFDETVTIGTSSVPDASVLIDDDNNPVIANLNLNRNTVLRTIRSGSFSGGIGKLTVNGATTLNDQAMLELKLDTDTLVLNDQSQYEIKRWADIGDFVQVGSEAELTFDTSSISPSLWLHDSGTVLNNNGTIRAQAAANYIEATAGGLLDLDGSTGNGRILIEDGKTLQIKGELADDFNGTLEFSTGSSTATGLSTFHMHDDWAIGNGAQMLFGGTSDSRILGGALTATGALFDLQSDAWIEAPIAFQGSTITGSPAHKLTLTKTASFTGSTTIDQWVEVQGVGDITGANSMTIDSTLDFLDSATVSDSTINLNNGLRMLNGGSIQNSDIAPSNSPAGGLIAYTGPLTIGGNSNIDVGVLWNEGTSAPLIITGGEVSAKNWGSTDLSLYGGTARIVDVGNISLPGGLSFGSDETPSLSIADGSTATIGPTGNGDLTLGFSNGDFAELFVDGIGRTSPGNPHQASQLSAGNARLGNRGQGVLVTRNGGLAGFTGNVKIGEQIGALGAMTVLGVVDDGAETFQSQVHIGDPENNITADLEVGNAGEGYVTILDGGRVFVNGDAHFGRDTGGSGTLTVSNSQLGRDSYFDVAGDIHMGGDGAASASMNDGGLITANSLLLKSRGSLYQDGGVLAAQTLDISDEGVASITGGDAYLQNFSRSGTGVFNHTGGEVFIQGGTAEFNSTYAYGGPDPINQPRLNIDSGTDATVSYGFRMGDEAGDYAQARIAGATVSGRSMLRGTGGGAGADLHVGRYGSGGLSIEDGGYVKILDDTLIASEAGSFGTLSVLGTTELSPGVFERAELDVAGTLRLGSSGAASMFLYDGGVVKASSLNMGSNGTLNMSGGLLSLTTLDATNGFTNFTGGEVDIDEILGDVDFSNVTVLPGDSPGVMEIYGNASFDSSTILEIEIGGLRSGSEYDHLFVSEQLTLDGTLDIQLYDLGAGQFSPQAGDEFTILASDSRIVGEFDAFDGDNLPGDLRWELDYRRQEVVLRAASTVEFASADFDFDGDVDVDGRDLSLWERNHAVGRTTGSDFLAWQRQYNGNSKSRSAFAAATVPEPAGLVLMLLGLVGVLTVERQK